MDKIDIEDFEKLIEYKWICPTCTETNKEYIDIEELEAVFCTECGNTFEIIKTF